MHLGLPYRSHILNGNVRAGLIIFNISTYAVKSNSPLLLSAWPDGQDLLLLDDAIISNVISEQIVICQVTIDVTGFELSSKASGSLDFTAHA